MKLWWVEDETDLREVMESLLEDILPDSVERKLVEHWKFCEAVEGDIVIHDIDGVGDPVKKAGIYYYCCSGNLDFNIDLPKPFLPVQLESLLQKHFEIKTRNKAS